MCIIWGGLADAADRRRRLKGAPRAPSSNGGRRLFEVIMSRVGALTLCAMLASIVPGYAKPPLGQIYSQPGPVPRGDFRDPYYGRQNGQICPRWCMEDRQ